ncbi:MAG TPA: PaaI family thioesterase [Solirubrobacterales bacterium]
MSTVESAGPATRSRTISWHDPVPSAVAGSRMPGLEYVRAIQAGEIPPPPIAVVMNFSIAELEEGRAVFIGEPGEEHYNPIGVVHGGYASTILDSALGCSVHTTLPAGVGYTSQTLEVKYLRPITREVGAVRSEAEVIHRGRKTATSEARLTSVESGKLLATATSTCLILEP